MASRMICQILGPDGRRCLRSARWLVEYLGNDEIFAFRVPPVSWARIYVCAPHAESVEPNEKLRRYVGPTGRVYHNGVWYASERTYRAQLLKEASHG